MECIKQTSKKYLERPSPPYKASECKNARKKGNDGTFYISTANIKGIYTWKKCVKNNTKKKSTAKTNLPKGIYSTPQPHFKKVNTLLKQINKILYKEDDNNDGENFLKFNKALSPFLLKMSDVKKFKHNKSSKWYFIQPQEYYSVSVLTRDNLFLYNSNDDDEDDTIFYDMKNGLAVTGSGGDEWYKVPVEIVKVLQKLVKNL